MRKSIFLLALLCATVYAAEPPPPPAMEPLPGESKSAPQAGDPSVSAQSALLGDPIAPGSSRYCQTYYRDPSLSFCPAPADTAGCDVVAQSHENRGAQRTPWRPVAEAYLRHELGFQPLGRTM